MNNMIPTQNYVVSQSNPDPLERIASALERIAVSLDNLDSIEQSLDLLSDAVSECQVKNSFGSSIAITGSIDTI